MFAVFIRDSTGYVGLVHGFDASARERERDGNLWGVSLLMFCNGWALLLCTLGAVYFVG